MVENSNTYGGTSTNDHLLTIATSLKMADFWYSNADFFNVFNSLQ